MGKRKVQKEEKSFRLRISPVQHAAWKAAARQRRQSVSALVRRAVDYWLEAAEHERIRDLHELRAAVMEMSLAAAERLASDARRAGKGRKR